MALKHPRCFRMVAEAQLSGWTEKEMNQRQIKTHDVALTIPIIELIEAKDGLKEAGILAWCRQITMVSARGRHRRRWAVRIALRVIRH
jgi:hypothetical protein